ncbi:VanZ family protein [Roseovarius sp. S1116L3]|uniref:VanZ family protein n=1 Tax=Roseovarius roseus TaxID=3342636 RepID=UPI0037296E7B
MMSERHDTLVLRWAWALTVLTALVLCVTTLSPGMPSVGPPGSDKWQHFAGFALLALPLGYARPAWGWRIVLGVAVFGGMIELVQPHVGRDAEWGDLAADTIGAAVGIFAARLLPRQL